MIIKKMKEKLTMEHQIFKEFYRKSMVTVLILGTLTALTFFFTAFYFEDFIVEQMDIIAEQVLDEDKAEPTNVEKFFSILLNNLFVGGMIILCGFLPLYGLPFFYGILSFASVGIIAGYGMIMDYNVIKSFAVAFFPHAVIEVIPLLYSIAIGMFVNKNIVKMIFFKKKKSEKIRKILVQCITSYLIVLIPFFLIAATVEAFITTSLVEIYL
ncbi:stage II sporulation protein M [Bacillus weihaiensis]|uniref:stage II sporulation protein M n=1 Tax=Bacillus weihaiensis TaxID=1547283 RepID=UPI0023540736|nr:stage II sporulation protein M [Bacillus weihaiensis]